MTKLDRWGFPIRPREPAPKRAARLSVTRRRGVAFRNGTRPGLLRDRQILEGCRKLEETARYGRPVSEQEIARACGVPVRLVRRIIREALKKLRFRVPPGEYRKQDRVQAPVPDHVLSRLHSDCN